MIDKRLFELTSKKTLILLVFSRILLLGMSIGSWILIAKQLSALLTGQEMHGLVLILGIGGLLLLKVGTYLWNEKLTYASSAELRLAVRQQVIEKTIRLGVKEEQLSPSKLAQLSVDGIEQLEIYYARFLPQFFYCMIASLVIFFTLVGYAPLAAVALLLCMPLIPLVIMSVMKIAKRILSKYWTRYTDLGEVFHENLRGMSTLKAFGADERAAEEADQNAESFRKATMSLLTMQLNSITIMDIISYSGAALGIGLALISFQKGNVSVEGMLLFLLLSTEFFIPMRQLGSLFHVAMNGISACKQLFTYLAIPEQPDGTNEFSSVLTTINVENKTFGYEEEAPVLKDVSFTLEKGHFYGIVGPSGSGKSTLGRLLVRRLRSTSGQIYWNDAELNELTYATVTKKSVYVDSHGYLYPTTIAENLLVANPAATEDELWEVLEKVQLKEFVLQQKEQLAMPLFENGSNLSGGQRQRVLVARALLKQADLYVFDEITAGIDIESERILVKCIEELSKETIVLFISHRLYNVMQCTEVLLFEQGALQAMAAPTELLHTSSYFKTYFEQEAAVLGLED